MLLTVAELLAVARVLGLREEPGRSLPATLADYLVPSAAELPSLELGTTVTPTPVNAMGVKGVGEAGTIGAAPAVMNAIIDALAPFGVSALDMPASPQRIWDAISGAGGAR